jgi:hypothetical protein
MAKTIEYLINPFRYFAGWKSVAYGAAIMVASAAMASISNTHFPDAISLKVGVNLSVWALMAQWSIAWVSIALSMYLGGLIFSKSRIRLVDFAGTQGMARFPYFIGTFFGLSDTMERFGKMVMYKQMNIGEPIDMAIPEIAWAIFQLIAMMALLVWMVALMYKAFSVSANLKEGKSVAVFIGALIVGVALSMFVNWMLQATLLNL